MTQEVKVMWMCTYLLTTLKKNCLYYVFQFGSSQKKPGFFYSTVRKNMKKVQINRTNTFINFTSDPNKMTGNQILLQLFVPLRHFFSKYESLCFFGSLIAFEEG